MTRGRFGAGGGCLVYKDGDEGRFGQRQAVGLLRKAAARVAAMVRARFESLRFRLLVLMLLAVLPTSGVLFYHNRAHYQEERRDVQERMLQLARFVALGRAQFIGEARQLLATLAEEVALPAGSTITLLDSSYRVLVRYPDTGRWAGALSPVRSAIRATAGAGTAEATGLDGVRRVYGFNRLRDLPGGAAYVLVGIPTAVAYAAIDHAQARDTGLFIVATILVLVMAWWGAEIFVLRRVRGLLGATRALESGNLEVRAWAGTGRGELAALARSFNEMAAALQEREREAREHLDRIERLNRVHAVISGISGAILRIRDRHELLREACRIAVEHGRFQLAWVGLVDPVTLEIKPVAYAGPGSSYVEGIKVSVRDDLPEGHSPSGIAVRENLHLVINDVATDPMVAPWRERALRFGCRAMAVFPLVAEGRPIGVMSLYATEAGFFNEEEVRLLQELAADTAFGLEYIEKAQRLEYLAYYDSLTGLPNRRLFEDRLALAVALARHTQRYLAVAVLDIYGFRQINDILGRQVGDQVLMQAGRYLAQAVRDGDTVARLGSDEFGILLADIGSPMDVATVMQKVMAGFPGDIVIDDERLFVTGLMGIAVYPQDGTEPALLLKNAEIALHSAAEASGSSFAFYEPELNVRVQERRQIEQELFHAIERGEMQIHYQPIVELSTRRIISAEALLRWHNRKLGDVPPARFIPVAEENGIIVAIGEWVLREVCRQGQRWTAQGISSLKVAVNVSAKQLKQSGFVDRIAAILADTRFDPALLSLGIEVTETGLMDELEPSVAALSRLREMGLLVYIDDFGTGYSSLNYLRRLPANTLKIDSSFIKDIAVNAEAASVVRTIIALADALGLSVVAEGVETEEQAAVLSELQCDAVQGYLFSRPGPAEAIEPLFGRQL